MHTLSGVLIFFPKGGTSIRSWNHQVSKKKTLSIVLPASVLSRRKDELENLDKVDWFDPCILLVVPCFDLASDEQDWVVTHLHIHQASCTTWIRVFDQKIHACSY